MKILFIKRTLDRSELELALNLKARGVDITVMTPETSIGVERLQQAGAYIKPHPYRSKICIPLIRQIRKLVQQEGFSIIHATDGKSLANAIWATYFLKVRIVSYRGTLARIRKSDISYWMGILHPKVDRVICVNTDVYNYMKNFYPEEKLLLNIKGYDPEWQDVGRQTPADFPELPANRFVLMYIAQAKGRPNKGLDILLQAMHLIENPEVHLVFIGSYDHRSLQLAQSGPAAARIHFLGQKKIASAYLSKANVFVLPSTRDGLPRVIKEAMAEALPVICSNIPGPTDLVLDGKTGLLVSPGSASAIRDAVEALYRDRQLAITLGANGKQYLIDAFSSTPFADKTLTLYQELCSESTR